MAERDTAPVRVHVRCSIVESEVSHRLEHDRGEGLVDLEHGDVVECQARLAEGLADRLGVAVQHHHGVDAGEAEGDEAGARLQSELGRFRGRRQERCRRAVDDLARVAGGDGAVGLERRGERRHLRAVGVAPEALIGVEGDRLARLLGRDRHELVREPPPVARSGSPLVGARRIGVLLLARELPALGDQLCRGALEDDVVAVEELRRERFQLAVGSGRVRAHRDPAHRLDAARDRAVVDTGLDGGRDLQRRLHRRAAHAVHARAADGHGEPGLEGGDPADVQALLAELGDAAGGDVLDRGDVDARSLDEGGQRPGEQFVRTGIRESPATATDRRPDGIDDHALTHLGHRHAPPLIDQPVD